MLEWISAPSKDTEAEPNIYEEGIPPKTDDAPTTPAPLFAVRALSQLVWGTPKATEMSRRTRGLHQQLPLGQHVSAKTQVACPSSNEQDPSTPKSSRQRISPARRPGILVTPGTGGGRRKQVSFQQKVPRAALQDTAEEETRNGPGRFISPKLSSSKPALLVQENAVTAVAKRTKSDAINYTLNTSKDNEITEDLMEPHSVAGTYWKSQYESYLAQSTKEMKKLIKKEQAAKNFARHRDTEAAQLLEALRREQAKVSSLEKKLANYVDELGVAIRENSILYPNYQRTCPDDTAKSPSPAPTKKARLETGRSEVNTQSHEWHQSKSRLEDRICTLDLIGETSKQRMTSSKNQTILQPSEDQPGRQWQVELRAQNNERNHETGSDIWADAGDVFAAAHESSPAERTVDNNSLRSRSVNTLPTKGPDTVREEKMSSERRAAALKRLEDRRRNRNKGVPDAI